MINFDSFLVNEHWPTFRQKEVAVSFKYNEAAYVTTVTAEDPDVTTCEETENTDGCPCGDILYAIEHGNEESIFLIEPTTGVLRLASGDSLPSDKTVYELTVSARNPVHQSRKGLKSKQAPNDDSDTCIVRISTQESKVLNTYEEAVNKPHSRRKRSVSFLFNCYVMTYIIQLQLINTESIQLVERANVYSEGRGFWA